MTIHSFPLLRLPQEDILRVLKSIEFFDLILFSFSSRRSKSLVESIKLKSSWKLNIVIVHGIRISFRLNNGFDAHWIFYTEEFQNRQPNQPPMMLTVPKTVRFHCETDKGWKFYEFKGVSLEMKGWVEHLKSILHQPIINQLAFFRDDGFFNIESIKNAVGEVKQVDIISPGTDEQNQEKMNAFMLRKQLTLGHDVWQTRKPPSKVLIQNFDMLEVGRGGINSSMTLDDLSLMHSKWNNVSRLQMTAINMNKYLKLWMRGRTGHKMEYFAVMQATEVVIDKATGLKGIKHQEQGIILKRWFKTSDDPIHWPVFGGYDIRRQDGTYATIQFNGMWMEMYVWHSYCIGKER